MTGALQAFAPNDSATLGDNLTSDNTPTLSGTTEPNLAVSVLVNGVTYTTTANASGQWTITTGTLGDASYTPVMTVVDAAGNSTTSNGTAFTIDSSLPAVSGALQAAAPNDSGTLGDNITKDNTPTLTGTTQAGSAVVVVINGTTYNTTADGSGNWSVTAATLADGSYTPVITVTDPAGNMASGNGTPFTIDTSVPAINGALQAVAPNDSGVTGDNLTNNTTPTIAGTTQAGSTVSVVVNGATYTTTADASGNWNITTAALANGTYTPSITVTDPAGNSATSNGTALQIDALTPTIAITRSGSTSLLNGATTTITFTLSENSSNFDLSDVQVSAGASLTGFSGSGTVYTATLTAGSPDAVLSVASGAFSDAAGNSNADGADGNNTLIVIAANDAPVNTVPGAQSVSEDVSASITGLSVADVDAGSASISVTLSVAHGTLTISGGSATISGNGTGSVVLTGTVASINSSLSAVNGVVYQSVLNYNGSDTLTMLSSDLGNTGTGGTLTDSDSVAITVAAVNDAPVLDAAKSPSISTVEYLYSGGPDSTLSAPTGASPAGSMLASTLIDYASPAGQVDNVTEVDASPVLGMGITRLAGEPTNTLWYTTNGGTNWKWVSNTGDSSGGTGFFGADGLAGTADDRTLLLTLTANDKIIFDGGHAGINGALSDAITFRAWDQTAGTAGSFGSGMATGGTSSLSASTDTISVTFTTQTIDLSRLPGDAGATINGGTAGARFGWDVSTVGDVNGDGFEDFIVAENGVTATGKGASYLFYGSATPLGAIGGDSSRAMTSGSANATYTRSTTAEQMQAVSNVGDINNDGYDDFVMAGTAASGTLGSAYVILGGTSNASITAMDSAVTGRSFRITGAQGLGDRPLTVAGAGDVNGDGYADLLVGSQLADPVGGITSTGDNGLAYIIYGHAGSSFGGTNSIITLNNAYNINGSTDETNVAGVLLDSDASAGSERGMILAGSTGGTDAYNIGHAVASGGDVNGDGYSDFLVTAHRATSGNTVHLAFGSKTQTLIGNTFDSNALAGATYGWVQTLDSSAGTSAETGQNRRAPAIIGDINGDGLADLAVASDYDAVLNSQVYIVYGKSDATGTNPEGNATFSALATGSTGFTISSGVAGQALGQSIRAAGDINGDGYDDFIVGSPLSESGGGTALDQGNTYIIYGRATASLSSITLSSGLTSNRGIQIRGGTTGDQAGFAVASAGDVNGDGLNDLLIGASYRDTAAGTDAGSAYLVYGSTNYGNSTDARSVAAFNSAGNTAAVEAVYGTSGADVISGSGIGAGDSATLGAGNDLITTNSNTFLRIDGGTGFDSLKLSGTLTLDMTSLTSNLSGKIRDIEKIDMQAGSSAVTLTLSEQDVYQMAGDFDVPAGGTLSGRQSNSLFINGDSADTLTFSEGIKGIAGNTTGWTSTGQIFNNPVGDGINYELYTRGSAKVYVAETAGIVDKLIGGSGSDALNGGGGSDLLVGGNGGDTLNGGIGDDVLIGDGAYIRNSSFEFWSGAVAQTSGVGDYLFTGSAIQPGLTYANFSPDNTYTEVWTGTALSPTVTGFVMGNATVASHAGLMTADAGTNTGNGGVTFSNIYAGAGEAYDLKFMLSDYGAGSATATGEAWQVVWNGVAVASMSISGGVTSLASGVSGSSVALGNIDFVGVVNQMRDYTITGLSSSTSGSNTLVLQQLSNAPNARNLDDVRLVASGAAVPGADTIDGGAGNDVLYGGGGNDVMTGGTGTDTFVLSALTNNGNDTISDFTVGSDKLKLVDLLPLAHLSTQTPNLVASPTILVSDLIDSAGSTGHASMNQSVTWNDSTHTLSLGWGGSVTFTGLSTSYADAASFLTANGILTADGFVPTGGW